MNNSAKTFLLMAALTALALGVGQVLGGRGGMGIALGFALLMNFGSYWFSDKIVLHMYGAEPVAPEQAPDLYRMLERLSANAGIPVPRLHVMNNPVPNAFATGRNPEHGVVALTTGILQALRQDELEGVVAHELAHIKNRDILTSTVAATMAGAVSSLAHMAAWASMFGGYGGERRDRDGMGGLGALLMIFLAPVAAALIQLGVSRSREYAADADGARISGKPLALASALTRLNQAAHAHPMNASPATAHLFIVSPLAGVGGMAALFSTHPRTEERVSRLRALHETMVGSGAR